MFTRVRPAQHNHNLFVPRVRIQKGCCDMKTGKVTQQRSNAGGRKHTDSHKSPECVPPRRIALELRHDRDGRYRWLIQETDEDTEVSGATPEQAWKDAAEVWRGHAWNFEKVSDTA